MILAAGLTPAWQQILLFDSFRIGEVNRARESHWCASGKMINVAMAAATLDEEVSLVCSAGGATGAAMQRDLTGRNIRANWVSTPAATRVCTTMINAAQGAVTELVEEAAAITPEAIAEFVSRTRNLSIRASVTVLSGSLPIGAPAETFANVMSRSPSRFVLDFRGEALRHCLPLRPFLVKPNREELVLTLGQNVKTEQELLSAMRWLNQQGVKWVVVSEGRNGVWVTSDTVAVRFVPPSITTINPIGSGDCLAAGIAVELGRRDDVLAAVRFGMGAAANNAELLMPARLNRERSAELARQVRIEHIES